MSRIRHDKSTSNLLRHADICDPDAVTGPGSIKAFAQGSTYNPSKHRMKIALWVARRHRPFSIVQDDELLDIFNDLNSQCVTPSRVTVSWDVKEIFRMSQAKVAALLQVCFFFFIPLLYRCIRRITDILVCEAYPGKLHLCVDGWTSPQVVSFLGATVHWIRDGQIHSIILDFIR